jgi:hypothetical protein
MRSIWRHLTYANVTATLCLFLLLGGGAAYAATQLAKGSVGTRQLKSGAVSTAKIKDGAVRGAKVAVETLGKVPSAGQADTAADALTLQGSPASAFVRGSGSMLAARRDLQIGDSSQMLAVPGIGTLTASCKAGVKKPEANFTFTNQSGGTMDETLEYSAGIDAGTVLNGKTSSSGEEGITAQRMKVATRTTPVTVATFDLSMAAEGPTSCGLFVQALVSTSA